MPSTTKLRVAQGVLVSLLLMLCVYAYNADTSTDLFHPRDNFARIYALFPDQQNGIEFIVYDEIEQKQRQAAYVVGFKEDRLPPVEILCAARSFHRLPDCSVKAKRNISRPKG